MAKFNLEKARKKLRAAEDEALRDEILAGVECQTTQHFLDDLKKECGWTITHFARYIGYSQKAVKSWYNENKNTIMVRDICRVIKRTYWHHRNDKGFNFGFDEEMR